MICFFFFQVKFMYMKKRWSLALILMWSLSHFICYLQNSLQCGISVENNNKHIVFEKLPVFGHSCSASVFVAARAKPLRSRFIRPQMFVWAWCCQFSRCFSCPLSFCFLWCSSDICGFSSDGLFLSESSLWTRSNLFILPGFSVWIDGPVSAGFFFLPPLLSKTL